MSTDSRMLDQVDNPETAEKLQKLMEILLIGAESTDIHNFSNFPQEEDVTVTEWMTLKGLYDDPMIQGLIKFLTNAWVGREPHECGIHYVLDYIKSAGGLISINSDGPDGAQELKVQEGRLPEIVYMHKHSAHIVHYRNLGHCNLSGWRLEAWVCANQRSRRQHYAVREGLYCHYLYGCLLQGEEGHSCHPDQHIHEYPILPPSSS